MKYSAVQKFNLSNTLRKISLCIDLCSRKISGLSRAEDADKDENKTVKIKKIIELKVEERVRILGDGLFVDLKDVDDHTAGSRKLLMTDMALEVFGLLMLHQYLLIVEFSVAVVAPYL